MGVGDKTLKIETITGPTSSSVLEAVVFVLV